MQFEVIPFFMVLQSFLLVSGLFKSDILSVDSRFEEVGFTDLALRFVV